VLSASVDGIFKEEKPYKHAKDELLWRKVNGKIDIDVNEGKRHATQLYSFFPHINFLPERNTKGKKVNFNYHLQL
jgi:hypothetical protein